MVKCAKSSQYVSPASSSAAHWQCLLSLLSEVIALHIRRQHQQRQAFGAAWVDSGRLFTMPDGVALDPVWISQKFERYIARHPVIRARYFEDGWTTERIAASYRLSTRAVKVALQTPLPPVRLHDTRHGAASLGLAAGVDINIISAECGHATTAFTRDVYQHIYPKVAKDAANATASIVPRAGKIPNSKRAHVTTLRSPQDKTDTTAPT